MNRSLLTTVLRHTAGPATGVPDGELLRKFAVDRNEAAFAELVRRHGPMVWAACRHQLPNEADAEDAFQATFLALVQSPAAVRDEAAVGGWLHRVAVRAALKVRRVAARRRRREERAAGTEADRPVPDSTWDTLLAAVHEEVERLPAALRTAFVLCDLEGVRQPDAAARLGWKLGTLSGRLTRARQQLLDRLGRRGLAPAAAVGGLGLTTAAATAAVPRRLVTQILAFAGGPGGAPGAIAPAVLTLATEIIPMTWNRTKLIAAALLVAAGLVTSTGAVLMPTADAQSPASAQAVPATPAAPTPPVPPKPPVAVVDASSIRFTQAFAYASPQQGKWDYKFVAGGLPKDFVRLFTDLGNEGWEYCGSSEVPAKILADAAKAHPDKVDVRSSSPTTLIFKRPVQFTAVTVRTAPAGAPATYQAEVIEVRSAGPAGGNGLLPPKRDELVPKKVVGAAPALALRVTEDKPAGRFQIVAVKYALVQQLAATVSELYGDGKDGGKLQIVADPRTNSLILRGDAGTMKEAEELIKKLDVPDSDATPAPTPRSRPARP
ncbi:sigma-70 family RNA polymerase sigma factor [Fimbriiglobus ruber]|uniref:High-affnity carbon uptake protein Hat/HatR n=1 Tax=Fimbriiglobus ruber TaxID=1908690 RepID=A0A225DM89_9BACT|nr:sigma-70 family RNA polymerase sigma factor [Fimbriiglobus ruber]OWK38596.1 High-affnity carbon uptake protein Hat/HatR [Fimbriiglobus ruber]